jgi:hypothetical protein
LLSDIFETQIAEVRSVIRADGDPRDNLSRALEMIAASWRTQHAQ